MFAGVSIGCVRGVAPPAFPTLNWIHLVLLSRLGVRLKIFCPFVQFSALWKETVWLTEWITIPNYLFANTRRMVALDWDCRKGLLGACQVSVISCCASDGDEIYIQLHILMIWQERYKWILFLSIFVHINISFNINIHFLHFLQPVMCSQNSRNSQCVYCVYLFLVSNQSLLCLVLINNLNFVRFVLLCTPSLLVGLVNHCSAVFTSPK